MNIHSAKGLLYVKNAVEANYYVSLIVALVCAVTSFIGTDSLFDINSEMYGPLANNLRFVLVYVVLSELGLFFYCFIKNSFKELTILGFFLILLIGAMEFYGRVNQIPIDDKFYSFLLYVGLSNIFYGILAPLAVNDDSHASY